MTLSVCLGEICEFAGGGTPSRKISEYWNGGIPWASVKDFGSDRISRTLESVSPAGLTNSATRVVPAGTVLLVTRVGLGKVAIAEVDLAINQDVKALFPSSAVTPEYLLWALKHATPRLVARGTGATVKGVTLKDVKELDIPLPALDEQRRIVAILNRAAKIGRLRAQAAERMEEFVPALFVRMFGDPVRNPYGYRQKALSQCAVFISGATPSKRNAAYWDGSFPWVSPKDMKADLISDSEDHVSSLAFEETSLKEVPARTPIMVVRGMILAHTVPMALTARPVAINQDMKAIGFDGSIDPVFGLWCLKALHERILEYVDTAAHGTKRIEMSRLGTVPIPIPSVDLQGAFSRIVTKSRQTFDRVDASRAYAKEAALSLSHGAFGDGL